jgi:uncharacterized OsmC-like protein
MEEKRMSLKPLEKEHTYTANTSYGELLVGEKGYRPMELVLVALAGCTEAVEDAVKLSVEKYCSVYAMLKNSVNIRVRWKVLGKADSEKK